MEPAAEVAQDEPRETEESWRLVERYVEWDRRDWRLVFRRGDEVLEVSVPEDAWRAFDTKPD